MYLKFLYKHTIHINFPFKPNFLFISGFTAIVLIKMVVSTIRANLPDYLCNPILIFVYRSESISTLSSAHLLVSLESHSNLYLYLLSI